MPIFLRTLQGHSIPVPKEATFVEIRSADNRLAAVVFNNANGVVVVAKPGDKEFNNYAQGVGLLVAPNIPILKPKG